LNLAAVAMVGFRIPLDHHSTDRTVVYTQEERWGCIDRRETVGRAFEAAVAWAVFAPFLVALADQTQAVLVD
jgi:hypothetical protein